MAETEDKETKAYFQKIQISFLFWMYQKESKNINFHNNW